MKKQEAKIAWKTPGPGCDEHTAPPGAVVTVELGNRKLTVWLEEEICAMGHKMEYNWVVDAYIHDMYSCDG